MQARTVAYPHPVVGHEDDAIGAIECTAPIITFQDGSCSLVFETLRVTNQAVEELIREGRLALVVRLECGATMFRESWVLRGGYPYEVKLQADRLLGRVDVAIFVVAVDPLASYRPSEVNPDYGDATFTLESGAVVAIGPEFPFAADKGFDPLRGDMSSLMRVRAGDFEGPFRVNFDSNLIEIELGRADWTRYLKLKQGGSEVLHSSLVLPVLTEAIGIVRAEESDSSAENRAELVWFQRLKLMTELRGLEEQPLVQAAQALLDNPFQRSADAVLRQQAQDEED